MLFSRQSNDVAEFVVGEIVDRGLTIFRNLKDTLVDVVFFDPAFRKEVVYSSSRGILRESDRAVHFEVSVPETGRHSDLVVRHVFKDNSGPVFCGHRTIVLSHCSYFLRHPPTANRFWQTPLPNNSCKRVVASFIMLALYDVYNDHASGSQRVHNEKKPGPPIQREPGAWSVVRTMYNNLSRLKTVGTIRGTDAVEAPAPHSLAGCPGASAGQTAANHARTASRSPTSGGGQRVPV
jgi:hypothetical protein